MCFIQDSNEYIANLVEMIKRRTAEEKQKAWNPTGFFIETFPVNEAVVRHFLSVDAKALQRTYNKSNGQDFARHYKKKTFELNGEAIALDTQMRVRNGQHRLAGFLLAAKQIPDLEVPMSFAFNVTDAAVLTMDTHSKRTPKASMKMAGIGIYDKETIAIVRVIYRFPQHEVRAKLCKHDMYPVRLKLWEPYLDIGVNWKSERICAPIRTVVVRALACEPNKRKRIEDFCSIVSYGEDSGFENNSANSAAFLYHDWLESLARMSSAPKGIGPTGMDANTARYRNGQHALKAFLAKKRCDVLTEPASDLFPIPEHLKENDGDE